LTPSPILKVLSTIQKHRVVCLLMGGQACVFYGAAEFSRDTDLVLLAEPANLACLHAALTELQAERIAVPPLELQFLERGLAVHFRCRAAEAAKIRIDVMSKLRGVEPFNKLWERRRTIDVQGVVVDLMALSDLVQAKKTQRDKDWPMLARLVEADYAAHRAAATAERVRFWLRELRTPELLIRLAAEHPELTAAIAAHRGLLASALPGDEAALRQALRTEEDAEREADRQYWAPLKRELEQLRREQRRKS
jgi:hypothetical protein